MRHALEHILESAAPAGPRWYACYTKARHEKRVDALLQERSLETYLPLVVRLRQWKDRRRLVDFPMFPSYVFVRALPEDLHRVTSVPGVCFLVRSHGDPVTIPDEELENVRRFADALHRRGGGEPEPQPVAYLAEGQPVVVTGGPLQGVRGIVVEHRNRRRVLVGLRAIGQGLEVDVDVGLLQPLGDS